MLDHWCQLPIELAKQRYLPESLKFGHEANLEDVFNPGHTYKYAAPVQQFVNDAPGGNYQLWVPDSFPELKTETGVFYNDLNKSPVRWVVWSLGPKPESAKTQSAYAPMSSTTWYRRTGDGGVILRFADKDGTQFSSP